MDDQNHGVYIKPHDIPQQLLLGAFVNNNLENVYLSCKRINFNLTI